MPREPMKKRSISLPVRLWALLEQHAERAGVSVAEYIRGEFRGSFGNPQGTPQEPPRVPVAPPAAEISGTPESPLSNPQGTPEEPPGNPAGGTIGGESVDVDVPPTPTTSTEEEQQGGAGGRHKPETWRDVEVPETLRCEAFDGLWEEWGRHRREKGQRLTPTAARRQLAKLEGIGVERAILALNSSIANGYTGVFEPNVTIPSNGRAGRPPSQTINPSAAEQLRAKSVYFDPEAPDA